MQDCRADGEVRHARAKRSLGCIDADQRETLGIRAPAQKISQNREQLRADIGGDDARVREAVGQRDHRVAGSRTDVDDDLRVRHRAQRLEGVPEEEAPVVEIEIVAVIFLGALQKLLGDPHLRRANGALRRMDSGKCRICRGQVDE